MGVNIYNSTEGRRSSWERQTIRWRQILVRAAQYCLMKGIYSVSDLISKMYLPPLLGRQQSKMFVTCYIFYLLFDTIRPRTVSSNIFVWVGWIASRFYFDMWDKINFLLHANAFKMHHLFCILCIKFVKQNREFGFYFRLNFITTINKTVELMLNFTCVEVAYVGKKT